MKRKLKSERERDWWYNCIGAVCLCNNSGLLSPSCPQLLLQNYNTYQWNKLQVPLTQSPQGSLHSWLASVWKWIFYDGEAALLVEGKEGGTEGGGNYIIWWFSDDTQTFRALPVSLRNRKEIKMQMFKNTQSRMEERKKDTERQVSVSGVSDWVCVYVCAEIISKL